MVQDLLDLCKPRKGFWIDLGAGQGVWLPSEKRPEITTRKKEDMVAEAALPLRLFELCGRVN